jgi:hypothetical protein
MARLESRVVYTPHADATPEGELKVLATVYRFLLDRAGTRDRTPNSGPDDAAKETNMVATPQKVYVSNADPKRSVL